MRQLNYPDSVARVIYIESCPMKSERVSRKWYMQYLVNSMMTPTGPVSYSQKVGVQPTWCLDSISATRVITLSSEVRPPL